MKLKLNTIKKHYGGTKELDSKTYVKYDTEEEWTITDGLEIDTANPEEAKVMIQKLRAAESFVFKQCQISTLKDIEAEMARIAAEKAGTK